MKRAHYYLLLLLPVILFACKHDKKDMLVRNWHAVKLDNPQMDEMITRQQLFIDTVGSNTPASANMELYGTANIDSLKQALLSQLDTFKTLQQQALDNTWFNFKKNGMAILTFNGATDSTKWYFDEDGALVLDEMQAQGAGDRLKMVVVKLNDTVLKLRFTESNVNSVVTFHPEKN